MSKKSGTLSKSKVDSNTKQPSKSSRPQVSVIGLGYVGLATSVCLANRGYRVYGVEIDNRKCELIQSGESPIHEQGIDTDLKRCIANGSFSCDADIRAAVLNSDITFLTVGTPSKPNGEIDLKYIESAAHDVGEVIKEETAYHLVVVKSTVTPGSTGGTVKQILERSSAKKYPKDFGLCFNPEFLREGSAIQDTMNPDALVIGAEDKRSSEVLLNLYKGFYRKNNLPFTLITEIPNAEFVKYSVNTFRATQLSFLNSLANLCEKIPSADILEVTKGLSAVTKIDNRYLRAGLGYGGSCLPKDLRALTAMYKKHNVNASILLSAASINQEQPLRAVEIARQFLGGLEGKKIAVLGLTFKAGTDDVRESVAIEIVRALVDSGSKVTVYDPKGMENAKQILHPSVIYANDALACIRGAEVCIIATEWDEFRSISPSSFKKEMRDARIIDGRRLLDAVACRKEGILIYEMGRYSENQAKAEIKQIVRTTTA